MIYACTLLLVQEFYGLGLAAFRWGNSRIHSFDHSISWVLSFHGLGLNQSGLVQETSRSAVLACAMASFAAVMCATLLSEPLAPSSA